MSYNSIFSNSQKSILISKIKGLQAEISFTRSKINKEKVNTAEQTSKYIGLRYTKTQLREEARHHLLAYAFIRGIPYSKLEKKCTEKPSPNKIVEIIKYHTGSYGWFRSDLLVKIIEWLKGMPYEGILTIHDNGVWKHYYIKKTEEPNVVDIKKTVLERISMWVAK
jgi:hypothetical protein